MARFEPPRIRKEPPQPASRAPARRPPIWRLAPATTALAAITALLYVATWLRPELTFGGGALQADLVWSGQWWRLVTSVFLHAGPLHFLFNVAWLMTLGPAVEVRYGSAVLVLLVIATGVAGGLGEMATTGLQMEQAVGISGAIYGLFFFGYVAMRPQGGPWARLFSREYLYLFVGWGVLAAILTYFDIARVANLAHATGAAAGAVAGFVARARGHARPLVGAGALLLTAALIAAGLHPVWSSGYQLHHAFELLTHGHAAEALPISRSLADRTDHPRAVALYALNLRVLERDVEAEAVMARLPPSERRAVDRAVMHYYRLLAPFDEPAEEAPPAGAAPGEAGGTAPAGDEGR